MPLKIFLQDEAATHALSTALSKLCSGGMVFYLYGQLGAGKTSFVRGFLRALGIEGSVKSPTFSILEEYSVDDRKIIHIDLYRLNNSHELDYLGLRDLLENDPLWFIEWPEKGGNAIPKADIECHFDVLDCGRDLAIIAKTDKAKIIITELENSIQCNV